MSVVPTCTSSEPFGGGYSQPAGCFRAVPGLDYDESHDRTSANPAIRGVQSGAVSTLRQKVTSFIDGMPTIGPRGTTQLTGVERVEVFRGPQSAAFGRATLAQSTTSHANQVRNSRAIRLATSYLGRNALEVLLGGPVSDTLG